jgi:esterase/lipase
LLASNPGLKKIKTVSCVSAPIDFKNKTLKFVPLLHHANKLVRWVSAEGLVPFRPNDPEHPEVNYQHVPIRGLYQLQLLVEHVLKNRLRIDADVFLYQADADPVVEPGSVEKLYQHIDADNKTVIMIEADRHGLLYENLQNIQQKICATIK